MQYTQQNFSSDKKLFYAWFEAMHTRIDVAISADIQRDDLVDIVTEMEMKIVEIERVGNRFNQQSEISYVNLHAFEQNCILSDELYNILTDCLLHKQKTAGYFDIAVNSNVDVQKSNETFSIDKINKVIRYLHNGVMLDLSGYLKGYALDKLAIIADKKMLHDILINVGNSSIFAKGNHPFGDGWKIKIPATETECNLKNECLTTSGNTHQTNWPIVNPFTGEVLCHKKPVSVISKVGSVGEVLSKVAYLASESELNVFLTEYDTKVIRN